MTSTALLLFAACASALPFAPKDESWAGSASGDDGRVGVTVSVDRDTIAPGETARLRATFQVLAEGPLRFPQGSHLPLGFLYLQTPAGNVFVYPESGTSPKECRALEVTDYKRFDLLKQGPGGRVIAYDVPLVNPSPEWRDPRTFEPVRPDFRQEGVYEAWVKYTIPKVDGVPDDAWHGTVETDRVRFRVRKIPVADRRTEATAEQIAHLEAYMQYMDDLLSGKDVKPFSPEVVEMPSRMSLDNRLQWALERTENEGFARHIVALLRKHQPQTGNQQYPKWWSNVDYLLKHRAALNRGYGQKPLKIVGPYLDEYAVVIVSEIERELAGLTNGSSLSAANHHLVLLLNYLEYQPKSPLRQRIETLARRYAKIPVGAKPQDRSIRNRLEISWKTLYALDLLRDGMPFTKAEALLGEPTGQKDGEVWWNYGTGSRRMEPGVSGKKVADGEQETIEFTNRDEWID